MHPLFDGHALDEQKPRRCVYIFARVPRLVTTRGRVVSRCI